ncbi:MAG: aspartate/methionine/tyrosine aminotransferase [Candidatus Azotimanducaceae bacterium]|jgi:aspartate/methionine/tyrosine aminotransferase|tara:strand:- start:9937 stop:11106 length:1170 start_codon:yes stop_codon:yes gene_type:complete
MYSRLSNDISPFTVMQLVQRASEFEAQGQRVVHFEVGEPDFQTAAPIVAAAHSALDAGRTKYTAAQGISELRQCIADFYKSQDIAIPVGRILVTSGASGGLVLLASLLLDAGDELLITDPGYPCNEVFAKLVGGLPKKVPVSAENRFQPTLADIQSAWGEKTKGVLLASPANPTGTMLDADELIAIQGFVAAQGGFFILDEIYQNLTRDHVTYTSGLSLCPDIFVLNSFSKYFGMTGWRLGWVVVPDAAVEALTKLAQNLFISPSTPAQYAAVAAFADDAMSIHSQRKETFETRAKILYEGLVALGFSIPVIPDGAFYLYVDISHTNMDSADFCWRLIEEYQVAVTPGYDFGDSDAGRYVRFAYTTSEEAILLGLERIDQALQDWGLKV